MMMREPGERNFDELAVESGQYQSVDELERENDDLWRENENLRQEIQELRLSAVQAEMDADKAYTCLRLIVELLPKGAWQKKAQRAVEALTQRRQRRFPESGYAQANQFRLFHTEIFDEYDEWGGNEYGKCRQKKFRSQRRRSIPRRQRIAGFYPAHRRGEENPNVQREPVFLQSKDN